MQAHLQEELETGALRKQQIQVKNQCQVSVSCPDG